ncbi:hypothetical protein MLD38_008390 [Melastoma candidum]|uniref:Uncharacterized protein n=1 Tax=Melastoma candidum TaxID=119954 RepID=A0ACB9RTV9_9MYRT|nr:hypothetical protein MLD38_008390 [Melastoma candidum]
MADDVVYHERQRLQFCLLHALNNLFQEKDAFTRTTLNRIADQLVLDDPNKERWAPFSVLFKPHHNAFTGNYDINVLVASLQSKGKAVTWHDRRNAASSIDLDPPDSKLMGIVLNVPVRRYAGLWKGRHWVAIRKIRGVWYNLDSDLSQPYAFDNVDRLREFLDHVLRDGAEVLLVVNDGVD